jgi:hypothetical protein
MPTDRNLVDAEQEWITKYRAALKQTPVLLSPLASAKAAIWDAKAMILSRIGRIGKRDNELTQSADRVARMRQSGGPQSAPRASQPLAVTKSVQRASGSRKLASSE